VPSTNAPAKKSDRLCTKKIIGTVNKRIAAKPQAKAIRFETVKKLKGPPFKRSNIKSHSGSRKYTVNNLIQKTPRSPRKPSANNIPPITLFRSRIISRSLSIRARNQSSPHEDEHPNPYAVLDRLKVFCRRKFPCTDRNPQAPQSL